MSFKKLACALLVTSTLVPATLGISRGAERPTASQAERESIGVYGPFASDAEARDCGSLYCNTPVFGVIGMSVSEGMLTLDWGDRPACAVLYKGRIYQNWN